MTPTNLYRSVLSCYIVLLTLTLAALMTLPVVAQDADGPTKIEVELTETAIGQIPYVNKLFRNIGVASGLVICDTDGCQVVAPAKSQVVCQQPCCQQVVAGGVPSSPTAKVGSVVGFEGITKFDLMSSLSEAMSHVSALEAALEAREQFEAQKEELLGSLAEALMRNAKLEAHATILEDQLATRAEIALTKLENVKLQAKLEFLTQREHIVKAHSQALAENQRLKSQLAKLEKVYSGAVARRAKAAAAAGYARQPQPAVKR